MVKLLKFSVVVNLLLASGAAYFAYKQYGEREIIKKRMQNLEESAAKVADNLKIEAEKKTALTGNIKDPDAMQAPLTDLEKHATARQLDLENTKADLAQTKSELSATKDKLAATETELANTKNDLEATKTELASTKTQLDEARQKIDSLGVEIADLKTQINTLNDTINKKEDEIAKLGKDLEATKKDLGLTKKELEICRRGNDPGKTPMDGQSAVVLLVNKDWNFFVISKGRNDNWVTGGIGLIHRGDKLIGKARITGVEAHIGIADVMLDSLEVDENGKPEYVRTGDSLWFPPSGI